MSHYHPIPERLYAWCDAVEGVTDAGYNDPDEFHLVDNPQHANLVLSRTTVVGMHAPVLDIDYPVEVYPSSQLGRYHLYLHKAIPWADYKDLLETMGKYGLIEEGYASASMNKGCSGVRPVHVKKWNSPKGVNILKENGLLRKENFELRQERDYLLDKIKELEDALSDPVGSTTDN